MNYDTIKLLNLEEYDLDINYCHIEKNKSTFIAYIKLNPASLIVCPCCGSISNKIHDYRNKKIKHGLFLDNELIINFRFRRFKCKDCQTIFNENNPFCENNSLVSDYTKRFIVHQLKDIHQTFTKVAKDYHVSTYTAMKIFDEYISPNRKALDTYISFDEFYLGKKSKHKYAFIIFNPIRNEIIDVVKNRHKNHLIKYFQSYYSYDERQKVKYISIDMYKPYKDVIKRVFPNAIIAVDSFHVIEHLNKAIDDLRITVMNKYNKKTSKIIDNDSFYYYLKRYHYFFTKDYDNIYSGYIKVPKFKIKVKKEYILKHLLSIDKRLTKMYTLKEDYRFFSKHSTNNDLLTLGKLESFIHEFSICSHNKFKEFGKTLSNWKEEILNSFIHINDKRLSNGPIESVNSRIKIIIKNGCGYTDFERLRKRIMYCINKIQPWNK